MFNVGHLFPITCHQYKNNQHLKYSHNIVCGQEINGFDKTTFPTTVLLLIQVFFYKVYRCIFKTL